MAEQELPLKDIYCTKCQDVTPHAASMDDNGEFVFHCTAKTEVDPKDETKQVYHHFFKVKADIEPEEFEALVDLHQAHNEGQVQVAKQQDKLKALLGVSLQNVETVPSAGTVEVAQPQISEELKNSQEQVVDTTTEQPTS